MNKEALVAGHKLKKTLLTFYIAEGLYRKTPEGLSHNQWAMRRKIGLQYGLTDKTLEELGTQYGITRERVRQLNQAFLDSVCKALPLKLKVRVSRKRIPNSKPPSQKIRETISRSSGGKSLRIREIISQGITDPQEIADILGISKDAVLSGFSTLRKWGADVPPSKYNSYEEFERVARNSTSHKKLRRLLNGYPERYLLAYYRSHRNSPKTALTTFSGIVRKVGLHFSNRDTRTLVETIRKAGIPIRGIEGRKSRGVKYIPRYWIMFSKHNEEVRQAILNDPNTEQFRKSPVTQETSGNNTKMSVA